MTPPEPAPDQETQTSRARRRYVRPEIVSARLFEINAVACSKTVAEGAACDDGSTLFPSAS